MTRQMSDPPERREEILVHDRLESCPYLRNETARMPLRLQLAHNRNRLDKMLAQGERRVGPMMYRPSCPTCHACIAVRVPVGEFQLSRSQKRAWNRNQDLRIEESPAYVDKARLELFNQHRLERGLSQHPLDARGYVAWLVHSWTETREVAMYLGDKLVCVTVIDDGVNATSAVYCYFDPKHANRSLGVYSVLVGIERCRRLGKQYHYLGLYVENNTHLKYKRRFLPHEQLIDGEWSLVDSCP